MRRKIIGILVCMLLVGTILPVSGTLIIDKTTSSNISGNTLYVGGSGEGNYTKIQDAINDAVDGDTVFVYDESSPYYEHVKVNKSINLIGEDRNTTVIYVGGSGDVVKIHQAKWVNISGFTIRNGAVGIDIYASYNTITGNIISNNEYGIYLIGSSNTITGNNISNNGYGIYLTYMGDFHFIRSSENTILKNNFLGNKWSAFFRADWTNTWKQNYWNRPRILPKLIFGTFVVIGSIQIPWFNIDWRPAKEPYDI